MAKGYKKLEKPTKLGVLKLGMILTLVAILAVSAVAIVKLNADAGITNNPDIGMNRQVNLAIKDNMQNLIDSQDGNIDADSQEFLSSYMSLLDTQADANAINDFLVEQAGDNFDEVVQSVISAFFTTDGFYSNPLERGVIQARVRAGTINYITDFMAGATVVLITEFLIEMFAPALITMVLVPVFGWTAAGVLTVAIGFFAGYIWDRFVNPHVNATQDEIYILADGWLCPNLDFYI